MNHYLLLLLSLYSSAYSRTTDIPLDEQVALRELQLEFMAQRNASCKQLQQQIVTLARINTTLEHNLHCTLNALQAQQHALELLVAHQQQASFKSVANSLQRVFHVLHGLTNALLQHSQHSPAITDAT